MKCFLGFRNGAIGLVQENSQCHALCHGGIKAREKLYAQYSLRAFFVLSKRQACVKRDKNDLGGVFK